MDSRPGHRDFRRQLGPGVPHRYESRAAAARWLKRLRDAGVVIHTRHRWLGWNVDGSLRIHSPEGEKSVQADALLLALGGGSWARLGSDGAWMLPLEQHGVQLAPLQPSNCGFEVQDWSDLLRSKFAGAPLKNVAIGLNDDIPASVNA